MILKNDVMYDINELQTCVSLSRNKNIAIKYLEVSLDYFQISTLGTKAILAIALDIHES